MEKRLLLALAFSFLVIGLYPVVLEKFYPDYFKKLHKQEMAQKTGAPAAQNPNPKENPANPASQKTAAPKVSESTSLERIILSKNDGSIANDKLKLLTNKEGGIIREISFPMFVDQSTQKPIAFISLNTAKYGAAFIKIINSSSVIENSIPVYDSKETRGAAVFQTMQNDLLIEKKIELAQDSYSGSIIVRFKNLSTNPMEYQYQIYTGSRVRPRHSIDSQYIEGNFYSVNSGKAALRHISETRQGKRVESQGPVQWTAIKDRHFSLIMKPKNENTFTGLVEGLGESQLAVSLVSRKIQLKPQESVEDEFLFYAGPNELAALTPLGLDSIINFGKMDSIGRVLVGALELLHKIFKNYGWTIIALTLLINLILFPLTKMSFMSMKRMQLIQPQISKLREQYKKNPEKLNKETMELYKKHKVNPFGGCLPMLLQMPVFIALYVALSKSVILINAEFLWIKDLSSPDIVSIPFKLPFLGSEIHVLPLIMVGAMVIQQKFTQIKMEGQDPAMETQQKMMAVMMPIIFGFIFYQMPSGLVLYWLTNTLWMVVYQLRLKKVSLA